MHFSKLFNKFTALVRSGFFHVLTGSVLNKAIVMITSIIIARFIDKAEYAVVSYADNIYAYISMFSGLGLPTAGH